MGWSFLAACQTVGNYNHVRINAKVALLGQIVHDWGIGWKKGLILRAMSKWDLGVVGRNTARENGFSYSREQGAYVNMDESPGSSGEGYRSRDNTRAATIEP